MSGSGRARNARGDGERLRAEIVDAAVRVVDGGDEELTLRGIAREAGISAPSIYTRFSDLQQIVDAVLALSFESLDRRVADAIEDETSPDAALVSAGLAYVRFGWEHRSRLRLMMGAAGFSPDAVVTFERIERLLRQCVDAGTAVSDDPHRDAFLVWVGLHGMATLQAPERADYRRLGPLDRPALAELIIRRLAGLRSGVGGPSAAAPSSAPVDRGGVHA